MTASHTVRVNGEERELPAGTTLLPLIAALTGHDLRDDGSRADGGRLGVAAAIGGAVVPRSRWAGLSARRRRRRRDRHRGAGRLNR